jgi:hypothetical protein
MDAAILEASRAFPKPRDFSPSYGTAGFRSLASLLPSTVFRWVITIAYRLSESRKLTIWGLPLPAGAACSWLREQ